MLLLESVDEALSSLGDSGKQAIYFHLKKSFNIEKRDIPHKIEKFAGAIEKTFGLGSKFLEILIMKHLYEKVGQVFEYDQEQKDLVLIEYVAAAKRSFLKRLDHPKL